MRPLSKKRWILGVGLWAGLLAIIFGINFIPLQSNQEVNLAFANIPGDQAVIFFGFPSCKKVCPVTMARLARIVEKIPADKRPAVVFINIDSESNAETSTAYAQAFDSEFIGVMPSGDQLKMLSSDFGLNFRKIMIRMKTSDDTVQLQKDMEHRGRTYLVRKEQGRWILKRTYNANETSLNRLMADLAS